VCNLYVQRDLKRPAGTCLRIFLAATLVNFLEATIRCRARRKSVLAAVDRQIILDIRIIVSVNNAYSLARART